MIIRQQAFIGNNKLLKGGLHCHTTRSDGELSPEDVMKLHKEHGYDFLAITDHRRYNRVNFAPETGITIICGMEIDSNCDYDGISWRSLHSVCLGVNDEQNGFAHDERFECPKFLDSELDFQKYLDAVHARNNVTFYCHPEWSETPARYFENFKGEFAMEVWNTGDAIENDMDTNAPYWDEMLGSGHKWWGVAVDDGHARITHCGGWVMVNSENNDKAIINALLEGKFYSSCGPVIKDFYVEDGKAVIKTETPCSRILFCADKHPSRQPNGKMGEIIYEGECDLKDKYTYVRAVVTDTEGRRAWTNPIFLK